ncbi:MAG: hypothetical protein FIA91_06475 [Geobacter sp.]|nr:hypothetical protein [Geobacter sp.]
MIFLNGMKPLPTLSPLLDSHDLPEGYVGLSVNGTAAVVCQWAADAVRDIVTRQTLHQWAAGQKPNEQFMGRGINYGVLLPAGSQPGATTTVVVRRNRHGGLFRTVTGELFTAPSRAPLELANYLRLASAGVNTPELIAYAIYPAFFNLVKCDVVTRRLPAGGDFPQVWQQTGPTGREQLLVAAASLLRDLARAGAWHADLNLKNIYIAGQDADLTPYILDIDRVSFPPAGDIAAWNFARLSRSARKWQRRWGLDFTEKEIERLAAYTKEIH